MVVVGEEGSGPLVAVGARTGLSTSPHQYPAFPRNQPGAQWNGLDHLSIRAHTVRKGGEGVSCRASPSRPNGETGIVEPHKPPHTGEPKGPTPVPCETPPLTPPVGFIGEGDGEQVLDQWGLPSTIWG